jgi:hypothetical protein
MVVYRWEPAFNCKFDNLWSMRIENGARQHEDCVSGPSLRLGMQSQYPWD